jgi:hypothetical protein
VFQIDPNGTIFVKSFGDQYNTTDGVLSSYVTGSSHHNVQEDWSLKVETGSGKVFINGDLDIECENFNVTARSNMNLHAGVKTNMSASGVSVLATSDDINMGAKGNMKFATGDDKTLGGFYVRALHGDFHVDSYKMNIFSETYTKMTAKGTPAESEQLLPYADAGHKGIEINSPDIIHLDSGTNISLNAGDKFAINSGSHATINAGGRADMVAGATANIKSGGNANVTGAQVHLNDGNAEAASGNYSDTEGARGAQKDLKDAQESVTEIANVVSPGTLPPSKAQKPPVVERQATFITSTMATGDD